MKKKLYISPLMEVEQINLSKCLLDGSPTVDPRPTPPPGPVGQAPKKNLTPVF